MHGYDLPFFIKDRNTLKEHMGEVGRNMQKREKSLPSLILVALDVREMVFENRSGVGTFTSNVGDDYTLFEVI